MRVAIVEVRQFAVMFDGQEPRMSGIAIESPVPYYQDDLVMLHHGDALDVARTLKRGSVDCIVTSPPYYGLRDYGSEGQYGLEENPEAYVETMRALFSELRTVLARSGTLWLNLGDSYGPGKNLLGMPWRVAFALQSDGWVLRNSIVWHKTNGMPESVKDRLGNRHENVFMFTRSQTYWFDLDPIREPHASSSLARAGRKRLAPDRTQEGVGSPHTLDPASYANSAGKNPGDVWDIATQPFAGAHFAAFPEELPRRAILAGCKPGGTVLDPFSGSGTTGKVASDHGRKYVGIDISAKYLDLSLKERFAQPPLNFGEVA